ncbi:MAG: LysR family transcriptional regulator [Lautropia sp.]|nr:LysR family transcriptional regulator [Lautropia sp.]
MDKIQAMSTFVAVVEAGSFVKAMSVLGISKAAVSRHVAELEQHLEIRLLQRTTRRLSLTTEGQRYFERCKEVLAAIHEAESEIRSRSGEAYGRLRICVPYSFGVLHLAPLWSTFLKENPQVQLDIVLSDRMVDLVEEGYDMAVRIGILNDSALISRRLTSTQLVMCASPTYLERHGTPRCLQDLSQHETIVYSYAARSGEWSFEGPLGRETVRVRARLFANNGDTCRRAALDHQGIILQPDFMIHDDLRRGDLVHVLPQYNTVERNIYALYPTRKLLPVKVRRLVDFLAKALAHPVWKQ